MPFDGDEAIAAELLAQQVIEGRGGEGRERIKMGRETIQQEEEQEGQKGWRALGVRDGGKAM